MSRARFAFAAHPDALVDLQQLPPDIRGLALVELQNLVHGSDDCMPLRDRLAGFHKVYVDPRAAYRMVIQFRPAPSTSQHKREIYLVAAGPRHDYSVYRSAQIRVGTHPTVESPAAARDRVRAARARSPYATGLTAGSATTSTAPHASPSLRKVAHR